MTAEDEWSPEAAVAHRAEMERRRACADETLSQGDGAELSTVAQITAALEAIVPGAVVTLASFQATDAVRFNAEVLSGDKEGGPCLRQTFPIGAKWGQGQRAEMLTRVAAEFARQRATLKLRDWLRFVAHG